MIQGRTVIFFPPTVVKPYQTLKAPSPCFGTGQTSVRRENYTYFTISTAWSKEKVFNCDYQIENWAETIFVEIFGWVKQISSAYCVLALNQPYVRARGSNLYWVAKPSRNFGFISWVFLLFLLFFSLSAKVLPVTPLLSGVFVRILCVFC